MNNPPTGALLAGIVVAVSTWAFLAGPTQAQQLKNGMLSGSIVSAIAHPPACTINPNPPPYEICPEVDVYTTPTDKAFVATQVCGQYAYGFSGSTIGEFAEQFPENEPCLTYKPGLALPKGETIRCTGSTVGFASCMIIGVLDAAPAQLKKSTLSGTVASGTAEVSSCYGDPPVCPEAEVFKTPSDKTFILTQAWGQRFKGSTVGDFPADDNDNLATYVPGIALPKGETIKCIANFSGAPDATETCTITGVILGR
jgi:hypothetical protein